ncbi:hypothetical protein BKA70DRAFT_1373991 [Coprinopsis sp. MPI-PUGE-AT-0042]|nr:hypothetical protein BKA70DRAFT_1373991 [Coprinopsis sp. MPI-PUGE-AT-0042]
MTETPTTIAREAKTIYQSLKEFLRNKDPFDKELEFQRKNLRRRYLTTVAQSKDTSYAFIASYKERLAAEQQQQQPRPRPTHGPVEHRKLLARFRQFLAEEEKFWIQLVLRMYRAFGLEEAQPALAMLGLPAQSLVPTNPAARESRLAILSKALICLGDIARYRELYNEAGRTGRPARRGAPVDIAPQPRLYDNAQQRYDQARWLVPQEGNPFHQLAILATYRKDGFASVYCYYRALCVRQPYETAAENLATVLQKALDQWKRSRKDRDRMLATRTFDVKDRVQLFKERVVILHAVWRKGIDRMDSKFRDHDKIVYQDFCELVAERHLPIDMISNVVVLAQSALWKHRMIRDSPAHDQLKDLPSMDAVDNDLAQRITAIFRRTLPALRIASKWLRANVGYVMGDPEFKRTKTKRSFAASRLRRSRQRSSALIRLHTIRFWQGYAQFVTMLSQAFPPSKLPVLTTPLEEDVDLRGFLPLKKLTIDAAVSTPDVATGVLKESPHPNEEQLMRISDLLADASALLSAENTPLVSTMVEPRSRASPLPTDRGPLQPVPPQQQQMMNNIRDQSAETRPVRDDDAMTAVTSRTDDEVLRAAFQHIGVFPNEDDDVVLYPKGSLSPVLSPIMQVTPITPSKSLNGSSSLRGVPSPPAPKLSPNIGKTPVASPRTGQRSAITASDLLLDVMSVGRKPGTGFAPPHPATVAASSSVQPPLLFGGDLTHSHRLNGQSIWSAGQDEQVLKFGVANTSPGGHQAYQTSPRMYSHGISGGMSEDMNGSIWSSSHPSSTQASQVHPGGVLPSAVHLSPRTTHHRIPSLSSPSRSQIPSLHLHAQDPFIHSTATMNVPAPPQMVNSHPSLLYNSADLLRSGHSLSGFQAQSSGYLSQPGTSQAYQDPSIPGRQAQGYHPQIPSLHDHHRLGSIGQSNISSPLSNIWGNHG